MTGTGQLLLVSAPSGAGKTSLVEAALKRDSNLRASISHTTRRIRPGEKDGVNYHFVDPETFAQMVAADKFLEHATVFGNAYGTSHSQVDEQLKTGVDVVLEIDWQGANQVRKLRPDAVSIFILPPDTATLEQRLQNRGQDAPDVIAQRLSEAKLDMSKAPNYDYIIVNDNFEQALEQLLATISAARCQTHHLLATNAQVRSLVGSG